jgi:ATP-binding cassette subfamily F protein 3
MLTVNALTKSYGSDTIFQDVSFNLNPGQRLGLVGPNGCGKTTLLRILTGMEQADSGSYHFSPPGLRLGYLPQGLTPSPDETLSVFLDRMTGEMLSSGARLEKMANALAATPEYAGLNRNDAHTDAEGSHQGRLVKP